MVQRVLKLVPIFPITPIVLALLPFTRASPKHAETDISHTIKKHDMHKSTIFSSSPQSSFEITLHGFLLWLGFVAFLMPIGILVIRMSNREECERRLKIMFCTHASLQILSVLLAATGTILSIRNLDNSFHNNHQRMGLALYGVIWVQALIWVFPATEGKVKEEVCGFWCTGVWGLRFHYQESSMYTQVYHKRTSKSINLWTIIFTAEVSVIAFFYLFQDKWNHIQKQGVILIFR